MTAAGKWSQDRGRQQSVVAKGERERHDGNKNRGVEDSWREEMNKSVPGFRRAGRRAKKENKREFQGAADKADDRTV